MATVARTVLGRLFVDWNFDGSYTDESSRLITAAGSLRLSPPESTIWSPRGTADRATLTLNNNDGRYSALLTSGALYADLAGGGAYHAPMYLEVSINGGANYYRVFTGVIKIPVEAAPTMRQAATITLDCRSRDELVLSRRTSTLQADFAAWHDGSYTEAQVMAELLQDAGLAAGDYTLDAGLFVVPWVWVKDASVVETCWQLAAACGGRFYCDPEGEFRYENAYHWLTSPHMTSQATLTAADYQRLQPIYDDRELYKTVSVVATPRAIGPYETLWEAKEVYAVTPGATVTITVELSAPAYVLANPSYTAVSAGGSNLTSSVTVMATKYAQQVRLDMTNNHATQTAYIEALSLAGQAVETADTVERTISSSEGFWTGRPGRSRTLTGNPWVQSAAQAEFLATFLRDRHELPRLSFKVSGYRGNPALRLGDRLTINDAAIMSAGRAVHVTAIDWRFDRSGFRQDLDCIDATSLYAYGESPGYFVLNTDTLNGTKKLFY